MNVKVQLDAPRILSKVTNDRFGLFVSNEWKRLIDPYTPRDTGNLLRNVQLRPFEIHYKSPYAHYMYMGEIYVDPVFNVGGFYSPTYGWFSRPNVKKVPSGRTFNYSKSKSPYATDHWDIVAAKSGQREKLYRAINKGLREGRI